MSTFQLYLGAKRIDITSGSTATTMVSPANGNTNQANTLLNEALDNSETAIDVDSGSVFAAGDTIRVDDEHMSISSISSNTLTVVRGHFGSTKATHSDNAPVYATNMATGLVYVVYYELGDTVFKTIRKANFLGVQTSKTTVIAECYSQSDGAKFILNERIEPKEYAANNPVTSDMIQRGALNATTIIAETRTDEVKTTQLAEALDNSETAIDVDSAVNFQAGDIILIDSEQMLVTATAPTASPNTLTVVRAHNGTSAVTHNDDTAIFEVHKGEFKTGNIYRQGVAGTNAQLSGAGILIDSKGIYGTNGSGTGNLQFDISATDGKMRFGNYAGVLDKLGFGLNNVGSGVVITGGSQLNEALDDSETAVDVDSGGAFAEGNIIKIDDEYMKVTGISSNTLTVVRGVNASTAAAHDDDTTVELTSLGNSGGVTVKSSNSFGFRWHSSSLNSATFYAGPTGHFVAKDNILGGENPDFSSLDVFDIQWLQSTTSFIQVHDFNRGTLSNLTGIGPGSYSVLDNDGSLTTAASGNRQFFRPPSNIVVDSAGANALGGYGNAVYKSNPAWLVMKGDGSGTAEAPWGTGWSDSRGLIALIQGIVPSAVATAQSISGTPAADRIVFWDESASAFKLLRVHTGLAISGTDLTTSSSARFKEDISDLKIDSSKIFNLSPKQFKWKSKEIIDTDDKGNQTKTSTIPTKDYGLIAEEVAEIIPDLVTYENIDGGLVESDADDSIPLGVKYNGLLVMLLEEVKQLRERVILLEKDK